MKKPKPPRDADNPEQSRRFIKAAQEAGAEEPAGDSDVILRKLAHEERTATPKRNSLTKRDRQT